MIDYLLTIIVFVDACQKEAKPNPHQAIENPHHLGPPPHRNPVQTDQGNPGRAQHRLPPLNPPLRIRRDPTRTALIMGIPTSIQE